MGMMDESAQGNLLRIAQEENAKLRAEVGHHVTALKAANVLLDKVMGEREAALLQKDDALKVLEKVARATRHDGYIGRDGQLLKEVERVLAGVAEKPDDDAARKAWNDRTFDPKDVDKRKCPKTTGTRNDVHCIHDAGHSGWCEDGVAIRWHD